MRTKVNIVSMAVGAAAIGYAMVHVPVNDAPPVGIAPTEVAPAVVEPTDIRISMDEAKLLAQSNSLFAIEITRALNQSERTNWTLSPFSVATALQMVHEGAAGQTMSQIGKTLRLPPGSNGNVPGVASLLQLMSRTGEGFTLNTANGAFAQQGYQFLSDYIERLNQIYGADVQNVDFRNEPATLRSINGFVDQKTQGMIPTILDSVSPDLRLVLVNAIYLKADWASPFNAGSTLDMPFNLESGGQKEVPTMIQDGQFAYSKGSNFQSITLPYKQQGDSRFAMVVLLPDEGTSVAEMVGSLTLEDWLGAKNSPRNVDLFLPKFKVEWEQELNAVLKSLGMTDAFKPYVADLSRMDGTRDLFVSFVKHKAVVRVDEKGTEAAAATAVGIEVTAVPVDQVLFHADRPFAFSIVEQSTGLILFTGVVREP